MKTIKITYKDGTKETFENVTGFDFKDDFYLITMNNEIYSCKVNINDVDIINHFPAKK